MESNNKNKQQYRQNLKSKSKSQVEFSLKLSNISFIRENTRFEKCFIEAWY